MPSSVIPSFSIDEFLSQEREKDLLRFSTAGSVDDGKSTLIGRLLYDTQSVYEDQVRSIQGKGATAPGQLDFALLTDGLRAEREQGITIDVAYRYFSTARRKFIIADTPGHEEYTRNMATGASTADAAVVLIDASKGVLVQSRLHAYIASLLRVRHVLVAVNKMDLIGYNEDRFRAIERDFSLVLEQISADTGSPVEPSFVPVCALTGENIVFASGAIPWHKGPSLLELLEQLPSSRNTRAEPFRFPVQRVLRPNPNFRGFAGQIASGTIRPGDKITVLPSGKSAAVERIVTWDGDLAEAYAPHSVTLVLNRELDISRGDLIVSSQRPATLARSVRAALVWLDHRPLELTRRYLLKCTSLVTPAFIQSIDHRTDIRTLKREPATTLEMNGIGVATLRLPRPIAVDVYAENRTTGAFILIDPESNATIAAGMVIAAFDPGLGGADRSQEAAAAVSAAERAARWGHRAGVLELDAPPGLIDQIERSLFLDGAVTVRFTAAEVTFEARAHWLESVVGFAVRSGLLALVVEQTNKLTPTARINSDEIVLDANDFGNAIRAVHGLLARAGILVSEGKSEAH